MNKFNNIFGQILQIFSKREFYKAVWRLKQKEELRDSPAGSSL